MEFLISAAENGGIVMMARIAMLRGLNHGEPDPALAPRRKRAKRTGSSDDRVGVAVGLAARKSRRRSR
jgi:hypothetical protein